MKGENDMNHQQTQLAVPAKRKSRKKDQNTLNNVVSLRISDKEKRTLERITQSTRMNVSDLVREAIDFWLTRRRRLCLEP
jgi:hypothetical protein